MNFKPKTPTEIEKEKREFAASGLLPKGWYDFEVMDAEEKTSKAGNEMIVLKLRVFNPSGGEKHVYDYLLESTSTKMFDFCESVGLMDEYNAGTLSAAVCMNRAAKVMIAIDSKNKDYDPKNVAKAYATVEAVNRSSPPAPASGATTPDDDEIPF